MKEIWKGIPEYKGIYQASNLGRIKSLTRYVNHSEGNKRIIKERILKQVKHGSGYPMLTLSQKGITKHLLVHRLIALAFIPNPENKSCVNHLDGNKDNNLRSNLDWCTYSENEKHSYRVLGKKPNKTGLGKIPGNAKYVAQYNMYGKLLNVFRSSTDAARWVNTSQGRICVNCRKESKFCHGYLFRFISEIFYDYYNKEKTKTPKLLRLEYWGRYVPNMKTKLITTNTGKVIGQYSLGKNYTQTKLF